jgi:ectoine hydroxylase-related dioxygenase (phytanoyl-CoA dioxygenase family)
MNWTSNGFELDTRPEAFGELRDANDVLEDAEALRRRMAEDGYLLLRGVLDRDVVRAARRELCEKLAAVGEIDTSRPVTDAIFSGKTARQGIDVQAFRKDLRTGRAMRALVHEGNVIRFHERFLGGEVRPLDFIWVRTVRVGSATGCHYDVVYMGRGTHNLYTTWIPIGDVPRIEGSLLVLENSHRLEELKRTYGALDVDRDHDNNPYGGGWFSKNPVEVREQFGGRWLTTDFQAGDMLVFTMFSMHCSLDNRSPENRIRLTSDTRYQLASEPVDERWIGDDPVAHSVKGPAAVSKR